MPDYNFFSGPLWLINLLHWLTFTFHLIAMNFMVGGLAVVLWGKLTNRWENPTVKTFVKLFPTVMAATVTLGVAPLLFFQLVYPKQVYSAAITSGWFFLAIVDVAIVAYYLFYAAAMSRQPGRGPRSWMLWIALGGLFYISFIYSSIFSMAERPELIASIYSADQSGLTINPNLSTYVFRWLHMIFGAFTVGSFVFGIIGRDHESSFNVAKQFVLWGTMINAVIGFIYLFQLGELLIPFMKTGGIHSLSLGIVASLALVHFFFKKQFKIASTLMFVSMFCMVIARHYVRLVRLAGEYDPSTVPVDSQWSVLIIFLICFVIAVGTVWYMIRLFLEDRKVVGK